MFQWLSNLWDKWSTEGMKLPFAYDSVAKTPSVTLMFVYIAFFIALASLVALHFKPSLSVATWTSMGFWVIAQLLYQFRKATKMKLDIRNQSVELEKEKEEDPKAQAEGSIDK